jgi:very-short-patch-repair endonuclease
MKEEIRLSPKRMKPLRWPTNKEQHDYMRMRAVQNLERALVNKNENWMACKLQGSGFKWKRQAQWGNRIFDFWCSSLGIAIEIDGPEHDHIYDAYRDEYNLRRSGILVLRVRNLSEEDASICMATVASSCSWRERKEGLNIVASTKKGRRRLVTDAGLI